MVAGAVRVRKWVESQPKEAPRFDSHFPSGSKHQKETMFFVTDYLHSTDVPLKLSVTYEVGSIRNSYRSYQTVQRPDMQKMQVAERRSAGFPREGQGTAKTQPLKMDHHRSVIRTRCT